MGERLVMQGKGSTRLSSCREKERVTEQLQFAKAYNSYTCGVGGG